MPPLPPLREHTLEIIGAGGTPAVVTARVEAAIVTLQTRAEGEAGDELAATTARIAELRAFILPGRLLGIDRATHHADVPAGAARTAGINDTFVRPNDINRIFPTNASMTLDTISAIAVVAPVAPPVPAVNYAQPITGVVPAVLPATLTGEAFLNEVFGNDNTARSLPQLRERLSLPLSPLAKQTINALIRNFDTLKNSGNDINRATLLTDIRSTFEIPATRELTLGDLENFIRFKIAAKLAENAYTNTPAIRGESGSPRDPIFLQTGGAFPTTAEARRAFVSTHSTENILRLTVMRRNNRTSTFFIPPQITAVDNTDYPVFIEASQQTHYTGDHIDGRPFNALNDEASLGRLLVCFTDLPIPLIPARDRGYRYATGFNLLTHYPATADRGEGSLTDGTFLTRIATLLFGPGNRLSLVAATGLPQIPHGYVRTGDSNGAGAIQFRAFTGTTANFGAALHDTNGFTSGQAGLDAAVRNLRNP